MEKIRRTNSIILKDLPDLKTSENLVQNHTHNTNRDPAVGFLTNTAKYAGQRRSLPLNVSVMDVFPTVCNVSQMSSSTNIVHPSMDRVSRTVADILAIAYGTGFKFEHSSSVLLGLSAFIKRQRQRQGFTVLPPRA